MFPSLLKAPSREARAGLTRPYAQGLGRRLATAGLLAAVAVALAGCRDSGDGAPGGGGAPDGGAPATTLSTPAASDHTEPGGLADCSSQDQGGDPVRPYCPPAPARPNVPHKITRPPAASNNPTPGSTEPTTELPQPPVSTP